MRILIPLLLLFSSFIAEAQLKFTLDPAFRREVGYLITKNGFAAPRYCGLPTAPSSLNSSPKGFIVFDTCANKMYVWTGTWTEIGGGTGGVITETDPVWTAQKGSYLTSAIAAATYATAASVAGKLNTNDTASMLGPYKHWTFGYLTEAAADLRYTSQSAFNARTIFNIPGIDTSGIGADYIPIFDLTGNVIRMEPFPSRLDLSATDSGIQYLNTDGVVNHPGLALWKGRADLLYPSLTGSYSNPSWITSLAWSKISGAPSFLTSVNIANINAAGTPSSSTFLRGDGQWATPEVGGGGGTTTEVVDHVIEGARYLGLNIVGYNLVTSPFEVRAGANINDGRFEIVAVNVKKDTTITGIGWYQTVAGVFTGDNTNSIALYTKSGGVLTKVAETANDENIFKGTSNTWRQADFTAPFVATKGVYYVSFLYNSSSQTTSPAVGQASFSNAGVSGSGTLFTNSARLSGVVNGQTSQPATINLSSVAGTGGIINVYLY